MIIYSIFIDPLNYVATLWDSDAKIVWEKDTDGVIFRKRLDGKFSMTRTGNETLFDKLIALTYCEKGILTVTDVFGTIQGRFHKKDLLISEDKCYIEIKFDREDEYTCLDGIMDKEFNILVTYTTNTVIPKQSIKMVYGKDFEFTTRQGTATYVNSFNPLTGWTNLIDLATNEPYDKFSRYDPADGFWTFYQNSYVLNGAYSPFGSNTFDIVTTWIRESQLLPRLGGVQGTAPEIAPTDCNVLAWELGEDTNINNIIYDNWVRYTSYFGNFIASPLPSSPAVEYIIRVNLDCTGSSQVYDRCRRLNDVITSIIYPCFSNGFKSDFFKSKTNPISGKDLSNLMLSQKSDVITPTSSDPATIGNTTFKKLMQYLKYMFNVDWAVDSKGDFRIEHRKYWDNNERYTVNNTVGIDLTEEYPQSLIATNEYTFEGSIPLREKFNFMEAWNIDFIGTDIDYSTCVETGDEISYSVSEITTDVDPEVLVPLASKEGFCMFNCESDLTAGYYNVISEEGEITKREIANAHLSWANLHDYYWVYGRFLPKGIMNGKYYDFYVRPLKYQKSITFPYCFGEFNPNYLIKTYLGNGIVKSASFSFKTRWITVELEYIDNI
jgi:hypothetical protein